MATAEVLDTRISRRDLLFPFAGRRKADRRSQKRHRATPSVQPEPPKWSDLRITRRQAFIAGGATVAIGTLGYLLEPWNWLTPRPESPQPESLEFWVAQARKMEDEYRDTDLSNKEARNQYTKFLAEIFIKYYPVGTSKEQLLSSVVFVNSKEVFEEVFLSTNQNSPLPTNLLKQETNRTVGFTKDSKTYINTANEIFQKEKTSRNPKFPEDWNPLKSLRLTLFHEFSHAISQTIVDTTIFSIVDSENTLTDKKIEGFMIRGLNSRKEPMDLYRSIDEASVELLSKYINTNLFHSFISEYGSTEGINVTALMIRLEQLLNSATIDRMELARLHKTSNLKKLLLLLAERYGINPQKITERNRILFGFTLFQALIQNNQAILQDYMNSARRLTK